MAEPAAGFSSTAMADLVSFLLSLWASLLTLSFSALLPCLETIFSVRSLQSACWFSL